ncbi:MAG: aldo/keto reductase [Bryobacteraceae bacterium]|nr:aldo/keto reductase [Bryobacteraceae bacterium]
MELVHLRALGKTGLNVSLLSFGASPLGNVFGTVTDADAVTTVHKALDQGVNLFDTAPYYGMTLSETRLGSALKGRRHEAILSTKCGRFGAADFDFSAARVFSSIDESLRRLQTDYVDILHVHDIEFGDRSQIVSETLPALEEVRRNGKIRCIGVTGLALGMLQDVAAASDSVDVVLSYCRYNLLNRDLDVELASFCKTRGIGLINASPLHMGLLAQGVPPPWHPAPEDVKTAARQLVELCCRRGVDPAALALQFALANPDVASTLVGIASVEQLDANLRAAEGTMDADLLAEIEVLVEPVRHTMWVTGRVENH